MDRCGEVMIKKMKMQVSVRLPEEIWGEILSKLPAETVLQLKCVSKSWRGLISSKGFIKRHLANSRAHPQYSVITKSGHQQSLESVMNAEAEAMRAAAVFGAPKDVEHMVGSCNGVVCVVSKEREVWFWNPATRATRKLPQIENPYNHDKWSIVKPVFCWDEGRDAYKVFVFLSNRRSKSFPLDSLTGRLYCTNSNSNSNSNPNSNSNSWKSIEVPPMILCWSKGVCVSGVFHWHTEHSDNPWELTAARRHEIVSMDSESGKFGMIAPPTDVSCCFTLAVVRDCLALVVHAPNEYQPWQSRIDDSGIHVWVMKQYGVRESWEKLAAVELTQLQRQPQPQPQPQPPPLLHGPNGQILLFSQSGDLFVYWPQDDMFRLPSAISCFTQHPYLHIQTLVSPCLHIQTLVSP